MRPVARARVQAPLRLWLILAPLLAASLLLCAALAELALPTYRLALP
jgi:hypothetical protein